MNIPIGPGIDDESAMEGPNWILLAREARNLSSLECEALMRARKKLKPSQMNGSSLSTSKKSPDIVERPQITSTCQNSPMIPRRSLAGLLRNAKTAWTGFKMRLVP